MKKPKFTYRDVKGSSLTYKEMDDNFRRVERLHDETRRLHDAVKKMRDELKKLRLR